MIFHCIVEGLDLWRNKLLFIVIGRTIKAAPVRSCNHGIRIITEIR